MKLDWLMNFVVGATLVFTAAYWPVPRADVQPAWERPVIVPTETVVPLERPARPPHPIEIYQPPGR